MSRVYRYATIGIIWIIAALCHWFGVVYFAPNAELWAIAQPGVGTFIEDGWRLQQYRVFSQYLPMIFVGGSLLWGLAKEYEDAFVGGYA